MNKKGHHIPIGVVREDSRVGIFTKIQGTLRSKFYFIWTTDNLHFTAPDEETIVSLPNGKKENPDLCSHVKFTETRAGWIMTYIRQEENKKFLIVAGGSSLYSFKVQSKLSIEFDGATVVENPHPHGNYALYFDGLFMRMAFSKNAELWSKEPKLLLTSKPSNFDAGTLTIIGSTLTEKGIIIFYDASIQKKGMNLLQVGTAIFSRDEPWKLLWRSDIPTWSGLVHNDEGTKLYPLGVTTKNRVVTFYWASEEGSLITATTHIPFSLPVRPIPTASPHLVRARKNPILEPISENSWESEAVFNPAAVYDNGKIHLFYRAIGQNGISVLGYASSADGLHFNHRLDYPVYEPAQGYGLPQHSQISNLRNYNPLIYSSGGGWNGYEDPRAVKIGKRIYVTYLAFGGWDAMRIALTSISEDDLKHERWRWREPRFISPPGEVNKNWVLFPQKIHGKLAILHSISPKILIHYVDSFKEFNGENFIQSQPPHGGRPDYWDNKVRGVGPPPILTKLGWLILYHANDVRESYKYKLGAMILDKDNPEKVLYRTSHPILCPDMPYENDGKPGIVYASGIIVKDNKIFVYYGGGDKVVCVATTDLDSFLEKIQKDKEIEFKPSTSLIT